MTTENDYQEYDFCINCGNRLDNINLECPICKKKKEKHKKNWNVLVLISILILGGLFMYLYANEMDKVKNSIKVYEAVCEEGQDMCFKGDRIQTTSIDGNYSEFLRTCNCQKCVAKDLEHVTLLGFNACKDIVKVEEYMRCEEFVCSNKFIIKINE